MPASNLVSVREQQLEKVRLFDLLDFVLLWGNCLVLLYSPLPVSAYSLVLVSFQSRVYIEIGESPAWIRVQYEVKFMALSLRIWNSPQP